MKGNLLLIIIIAAIVAATTIYVHAIKEVKESIRVNSEIVGGLDAKR